MKKISIVIPTYYEEDNVVPLTKCVVEQMNSLNGYDYEILFIDNGSKDKTRERIIDLCSNNKKIKAIFNVRNFGGFNSPFYGLLQSTGDCAILLCADFQDPVELIPTFIHEWEQGHDVVSGIKTTSRENSLMYFIRSCYYKIVKKMSDIEQIEHFTGFGLYDREFINLMHDLNDSMPFLRGIVAEYAHNRKDIPYEQQRRRYGHTSTNFYRLYDAAMLSFTSYTKVGLRMATFAGFIFASLSMLVAFCYLIAKLIWWNSFPLGTAPMVIGIFFMGSIQLFFIGLLGEYILSINTRIMKRPLVVEEKRINFL